MRIEVKELSQLAVGRSCQIRGPNSFRAGPSRSCSFSADVIGRACLAETRDFSLITKQASSLPYQIVFSI